MSCLLTNGKLAGEMVQCFIVNFKQEELKTQVNPLIIKPYIHGQQ